MPRTGVVSWFNEPKGFGFITDDADGRDVFVHYAEIQAAGFQTLDPGQRVSFELGGDPEAPKAESVRPLPKQS